MILAYSKFRLLRFHVKINLSKMAIDYRMTTKILYLAIGEINSPWHFFRMVIIPEFTLIPKQETLFPTATGNFSKSFLMFTSIFLYFWFITPSWFILNFCLVDRPCWLHRIVNHATANRRRTVRSLNRTSIGQITRQMMRYVRFSISVRPLRPRRGVRDTDLVIDATSVMHWEQAL